MQDCPMQADCLLAPAGLTSGPPSKKGTAGLRGASLPTPMGLLDLLRSSAVPLRGGAGLRCRGDSPAPPPPCPQPSRPARSSGAGKRTSPRPEGRPAGLVRRERARHLPRTPRRARGAWPGARPRPRPGHLGPGPAPASQLGSRGRRPASPPGLPIKTAPGAARPLIARGGAGTRWSARAPQQNAGWTPPAALALPRRLLRAPRAARRRPATGRRLLRVSPPRLQPVRAEAPPLRPSALPGPALAEPGGTAVPAPLPRAPLPGPGAGLLAGSPGRSSAFRTLLPAPGRIQRLLPRSSRRRASPVAHLSLGRRGALLGGAHLCSFLPPPMLCRLLELLSRNWPLPSLPPSLLSPSAGRCPKGIPSYCSCSWGALPRLKGLSGGCSKRGVSFAFCDFQVPPLTQASIPGFSGCPGDAVVLLPVATCWLAGTEESSPVCIPMGSSSLGWLHRSPETPPPHTHSLHLLCQS